MNRKSAVLWIAVIAVCCFFLGVLADRSLFDGMGAREPTLLERFTEDLDLSEEQQRRIADLLDDEDEAVARILDAHRDSVGEDVQKVRDETRRMIRGVLDEEQTEIFDSGGFFSK
jgi:hypothetical protein